jgi:hypothetical protein
MLAYQEWCRQWAAAVLRVLKPGGYLLAFGGTRTFHRLACALEDAGFEMRDCLMFLHGQGFPKGRGCLKPAWEPILLCRRPGPKVLPLGIDACRVETEDNTARTNYVQFGANFRDDNWQPPDMSNTGGHPAGRYPANVVLDDSAEVREAFAAFGERSGSEPAPQTAQRASLGWGMGADGFKPGYADTGTAARFFYTAKASRRDRGRGNHHPCVKSLRLMEWLVKLSSPPGGTVLDPFAGSGSTLRACLGIGRNAIGIELDEHYCAIAARRLDEVAPLFLGGAAEAPAPAPAPAPTLFDEGLTG